jgi:hypothetical protein
VDISCQYGRLARPLANGHSEQLYELSDRHPRGADQGPQGTGRQLTMLGYRQTRRIPRLYQDDVAPVPAILAPPGPLKRSDNPLSGNGGESRH